MNKLGYWLTDDRGLPAFEYTGKIPYENYLSNGQKVKLPDDPWFLLGNYQLTLFAHVSGEYELITGQRSWGRVNQGKVRNSGLNRSEICINGKKISLVGMDSIAADNDKCRRIFGCGFGVYSYNIENVTVKKKLSVKPSETPYDGTSAFVLEVTIHNNGDENIICGYTESVTANYEEIQFQTIPAEWRKVRYKNVPFENKSENIVGVKITAECNDLLLMSDRNEMSRVECFPPMLFMKSLTNNVSLAEKNSEISAEFEGEIEPNGEVNIRMIIGYSFEHGVSIMDKTCAELSDGNFGNGLCSAYADDWDRIIPAFENEKDDVMRRELRWHAYNLEAMATYSEYYGETKIPQGTIYDYDWGVHASARDNFQHALPLVYYNPSLAKSVLRYMFKRTTPVGEIRLIEVGNGYADNERYFTSDQQLYFFMLFTEYLRVTNDYAFLSEEVEPFPSNGQKKMPVIHFAEKCFTFLRDTVGKGAHGLVRLLNSDWNDAVYYIEKVPFNNIFFSGESHMNSAMVISIFQNLIPLLKKSAECESLNLYSNKISMLCSSMENYRTEILDAYVRDMGDRTFPRRMYFNNKPYGDDNMFLEPQGFTLQINELSDRQKRRLYVEMQKRVYSGEKLGAREQENPEFEDDGFDKGSRENGGFWWALNGPVIIGVSEFDKSEAEKLLKNMTLQHLSEEFPQYWSSYWSAADNLESTLIPEEGLPDQSLTYANVPVYCAHPHAWILYCYYKITE